MNPDLESYLNSSILSKVADFAYRNFFQPIDDLWESFSAYITRRMVHQELKEIEAKIPPGR